MENSHLQLTFTVFDNWSLCMRDLPSPLHLRNWPGGRDWVETQMEQSKSSLGTGWPSPGIWVFTHSSQAALLGSWLHSHLTVSWPRAWSSSPVWQILCEFWLPPLYSSGVCNSNLTVISITLKPSECSLYRHLNICQTVFSSLQLQIRRSCIECEKWKSKGLISKQWHFDQHSRRRKALYCRICQTVVGNTAVQLKRALESKLDTIL